MTKRRGRPPAVQVGQVIEVWDMYLGEWVRARVRKSGDRKMAREIVCAVDTRGSAWRLLPPDTLP